MSEWFDIGAEVEAVRGAVAQFARLEPQGGFQGAVGLDQATFHVDHEKWAVLSLQKLEQLALGCHVIGSVMSAIFGTPGPIVAENALSNHHHGVGPRPTEERLDAPW